MISVEEANQIIQSNTLDFGIEEVSFEKGIDRILRVPILADRDFPPYDRVTMDGIAMRHEDFAKGHRNFEVVGMAAAGAPRQTLNGFGKCLEVMTGSILPEGVDTVIRYEDLEINGRQAKVLLDEIAFRQNIHFQGQDLRKGKQIIGPGKRLSAPEIGVCASVGKTTIQVSRMPNAIILSTGDELVAIDQQPLPHQIRRSNVYSIKTLLESYQMEVSIDHLDDDYEAVLKKLKGYLEKYELILLSGGVSMGKFDYLPKALEELGVRKLFHKVAQRPGKPFWFGRKENRFVFAFPGNPVSSFMCSQHYLKPWLATCLQFAVPKRPRAVLSTDVTFIPDLTYFLEVKLDYNQKGELMATPARGNGSGDLTNLVETDAFIELPRGNKTFKKGEVFTILKYR